MPAAANDQIADRYEQQFLHPLPELLHAFLAAGLTLERFAEGGAPTPVVLAIRGAEAPTARIRQPRRDGRCCQVPAPGSLATPERAVPHERIRDQPGSERFHAVAMPACAVTCCSALQRLPW